MKQLLFLLILLLVACGNDPALLDDGGSSAGRSSGGGGSLHDGALRLEAVGGAVTTPAGTSASIGVRLIHGRTQQLVDGETVLFSLPDALPGSSISSLSAITDADGVAAVDLRAGITPGQVVVRAEHPEAAPLEIVVAITAPNGGALRVDVSEPANAPVHLPPYRVSTFDSAALRCDAVRPRERLPEALAVAQGDVPNQPIMQEGLPSELRYTVVVEAMGQGALPLALGCADQLVVRPGDVTATRVQLELIGIKPSGDFTVTGTWDFSEAVASQSGATSVLVNVIEFMANPGEAVYGIVLDEVEDAVGVSLDLILDIVGVRERVIDTINDQLFRHAGVETFVAVAADLDTMLNELQVTSALTIDKTDGDLNFIGKERWTHITVKSSWQCEEDPSPTCADTTIDVERDGFGEVSYDWTGRVEGYDRLVIESHAVQVDTGALLLFILENEILPALTRGNAHSVEEAVGSLINCQTIARRATQGRDLCDPSGIFCIGQAGVEAACEAGIAALTEQLVAPIRDASNVVDLQLAGTATLRDLDSDGLVDAIEDGETLGTLNNTNEPVVVEWEAAR